MEMKYNGTLKDYEKVCNICTIYIVLLVITFVIIIGSSSAYLSFHWYLERRNTNINIINTSVNTETVVYQIYKWEIPNKLI